MPCRGSGIISNAYILLLIVVVGLPAGVRAASPTFTLTMTPTPSLSPTNSETITPTYTPSQTSSPTATRTPIYNWWEDDFDAGVPGTQPVGWQDETDDSTFNAEIAYSYQASQAAVTRTAQDVWGKTLSPYIFCEPWIYSHVTVRVTEISQFANWKIGIQEVGGLWVYQDLTPSMTDTGTFTFDYAAIMGWTTPGTEDFYVQLTVEGAAGSYMVVDYVRVHRQPPTPTISPTSTITPTVTPTITPGGPTMTVTPTVTLTATPGGPLADVWYENFLGIPGQQPSRWYDETDDSTFNAEISYSSVSSAADVVRTAQDVWGKVLSEAITCDVNQYNRLEISVSDKSAACTWKVGIQEFGTTNYWDLCPSQSNPGVYEFNHAQIIGWSGERQIVVQITVEGAAAEYITVDHVRILGNRRQAAPGGFVIASLAEPEQLEYQSTIVKIKGANYYPSTHGWQKMWPEWDQTMIDTELSRAPALGINMIRAFIHYSEFGGPNVWEEMLARMEQFLYFADKYGLRVQFTFFPYMRDYSPAARADVKAHVSTILNRFQDDDRIFGWGITNEIDIYVALVSGDMPAHADALDWHQDLAAHMQTEDPNHLVIGATAWPDTMRTLDMSNVDVYTLHYFGSQDAYAGSIMRARTLMQELNVVRPIVVEEFGLDFSTGPTQTETSDYYNMVWGDIFQTDVAGGMVWILNDTEQDGTPHLFGMYTAAGTLRPGADANLTAYTGSNLISPGAVPRPGSPWPVEPPAGGQEEVLLNMQLPGVTVQWTPVADRADFTPQEGGVLIDNIFRGAEPFGFGAIERIYAFSVNMDQEADVRINIKNLYGRWYSFLSNTPTGYAVRIHHDSPVNGEFIFNLKHYVPPALRTGHQYFTISVGGVETPYSLDNAWVLAENVSVVNGTRVVPTPTPVDTHWMDDFEGTLWVQPEGWRDETEDSTFNCQIAYSSSSSWAAVTRTAESTWGKVLSPELTCDVSAYNQVAIQVNEVSAGTTWQAGIQEIGGAWGHWDLNALSSQTGLIMLDIPAATGWSSTQTFRVELDVEGSSGSYITLDYVRLLGVPATPTPSITPSNTVTPTPTQDNIIIDIEPETATTTPTPTLTPTPWLSTGQIMAYPNPARDQVTFAFTVNGPVRTVIDVYQMTGERAAHLVDFQNGGAGQTLSTVWDTRNVAAGIYFARVVVRDMNGTILVREMKKIAIIK